MLQKYSEVYQIDCDDMLMQFSGLQRNYAGVLQNDDLYVLDRYIPFLFIQGNLWCDCPTCGDKKKKCEEVVHGFAAHNLKADFKILR